MHRTRQLTDQQLAALVRVAGGDDLAAADNSSKRSARALHDRGLLRIVRSPWRAVLTDAGRQYLAREQRAGDADARAVFAADESAVSHHQPQRSRSPSSARVSAARRAAANELIEELLETSEKIVSRPDEAALTEWRRIIDFAKRHGLVPDGQRIEKHRSSWGLHIRLLREVHANSRDTALQAVPMPTQLRALHPVVKALQDDAGRLRMCRSQRSRSLLYFHGLTREAVRRGYAVRECPVAACYRGRITTYGRRGVPDYSLREGELGIVVNSFAYTVTIDQEHPEAEELERFEQLVVTVRGPGQQHRGRQRWRDRKRSTIDDSIAPVLREIETWAAEAQRQRDDRRSRWQAAMEDATQLAVAERRVADLEERVQRWRKVQDIRQYCDALEIRIRQADADEPIGEAKRELGWAREHADVMDPLRELPVTISPTLRPADLEPYLDGWSPYGPEEYRRQRYSEP